jgi:hypothetical protein
MLRGGYEVNSQLSEEVRDLIANILQISLEKRLSLDQIFEHPWVQQMQAHINNHLTFEKTFLPREVNAKISKIPALSQPKIKSDHRKNNSMTAEAGGPASLDVGYLGSREKKSKFNYHSH